MKRILALIVLLLFVLPAPADYTYDGTYYWSGGKAYTRSCYWTAGYWRYGCWVPGYWTCYYTPVETAAAKLDYRDPGWRSKFMDIMAQRSADQAKMTRDAWEHAYFMQALPFLGDLQSKGFPGFPYAGVGSGAVGAASGSTVFGYSRSTIADLYGNTDLAQLYQQATRLAENAQNLSGKAVEGHAQLVGQESAGRQRVAEIMAKGQAVQEMLRAIDGMQARVETKQFQFRVDPPGQIGAQPRIQRDDSQVPPASKAEIDRRWKESVQRCVVCHGDDAKNGFHANQYPALPFDDKVKVVIRMLLSSDMREFMPRSLEDQKLPGKRVPLSEVQDWLAR